MQDRISSTRGAHMYDTFMGLPLHVLLLHFVVVLLPLSAVASAAVFFRASWRSRYAPFVVANNVAMLVLTFITVQAGQELQNRFVWIGDTAVPRNNHETIGRTLLWVVLALALVSLAAWLVDRRGGMPNVVNLGGAAVVAGLAVAAIVLTVLAGHTGSKSHWDKFVETTDSAHADSTN
jgi:uncharacterized membrane protein